MDLVIKKCNNPNDCSYKGHVNTCWNICKTRIKCEYQINKKSIDKKSFEEFEYNLIKDQKNIPIEFINIINKNFWDLI